MRRLPLYSDDQIRDALHKAVRETGWRETSPDTVSVAAFWLAGYQTDDASLDHAEDAIRAYQGRL